MPDRRSEKETFIRGEIVDAHHHLWDLTNPYPWLTDTPPHGLDVAPFARDYGVEDWLADADPVKIAGSVHVQAGWRADDPLGETEWLDSVAEASGFPSVIVAAADLSHENAAATLRAHARFAKVRGIRMLLTWHKEARFRRAARNDYLRDAQWRAGLQVLADLGLSFDLQLFSQQMPDASVVARTYRDMSFIIDHLGLPIEQSATGLEAWRTGLGGLAACPNVAIKLSGFSHFLQEWTIEAARPFVDFALREFGPERCMFGSNYPVERPLAPFSTLVADLQPIVAEYGPDAVDLVFSGTARHWYRFDD